MSREERLQARLAMTMAEDRHADFGTFLRLAREQRGVSLQELALTTKISARVLEALERNDPSKLPGGIFSRSFVRAYAREVGLDPDAAVARFVAAFPDESGADEMPATTRAVEAESFEQRRRIVRIAVRLLGVAALVAFLAFIYYSRVRPGSFGAAAERVQPAASTPPSGQVDGAAPSAPPATDTAVPAGAAGAAQAPLVVVLAFTKPSWVSVSVDGSRAPSQTVAAGDRLEFAVQRSITMTVGNAGAVSVLLNGKPARSLGAAGQVVTTTVAASGFESLLR